MIDTARLVDRLVELKAGPALAKAGKIASRVLPPILMIAAAYVLWDTEVWHATARMLMGV